MCPNFLLDCEFVSEYGKYAVDTFDHFQAFEAQIKAGGNS